MVAAYRGIGRYRGFMWNVCVSYGINFDDGLYSIWCGYSTWDMEGRETGRKGMLRVAGPKTARSLAVMRMAASVYGF